MTQPGPPLCRDAVVIVPGILGSELIDPATGDLIWGLNPKALTKALVTGTIYKKLTFGRLQPGGLLGFSCSLPGLCRFDPYGGLVRRLRAICTHRDAVLEFPYDWRQPLAVTSHCLAAAAARHLETWRCHPDGTSQARLVFVAHSMGGLAAWHAANMHLPVADVALVLTLGTPFGGSVRAVRAMASGDLIPLRAHAAKLRSCAQQLPALHDLLPQYPALTTAQGCVVPTADDLISCGATSSLLRASLNTRALLATRLAEKRNDPPMLVPFVGTHQPTLQSFTTAHGTSQFHEHIDGISWSGDGTVYEGAAYPRGYRHTVPLSQQHGALAASGSAFSSVMSVITQVTPGPPQGDGIGLAAPDAVLADQPFEIRVAGAVRASCRLDQVGGRSLGRIPLARRTNDFGEPEQHAILQVRQPGLYSATSTGGGAGSVSVDILVLPSSQS